MKNLLTLLVTLITAVAYSQNLTPVISITSVEVDEVSEEVLVNYSLQDDENCSVWLKISEDGGEYFETTPNTTGDVGEGIIPSVDLSLTWTYTDLESSIADVQIKIYASDGAAVSIQEMADQVDESQLLDYMETIVGERNYVSNPTNLQQVRNFLTSEFTDAGLQTESHEFLFAGTTMENILGRKPGAREEDITYIIDGHFDGVEGSPGADDNASAVAGVLESLRILSQYEFEHSLRFIGFDTEEYGLIGSNRYNLNGIKPYEEIEGVLNFEMIGYYSDSPNSQSLPFGFDMLFPQAAQEIAEDDFRGNFITVVGNVDSNVLIDAFESASETYVPDLRVISVAVPGTGTIAPDLRRSDHASFWDNNIQALMLSDGANFRNLNYHTPDDVIDSLNLSFMADVVKATLAAAAELAVPISASFDLFDLSTILSVEDHDHDFPGEVTIFPNPTAGILTLEISGVLNPFRTRLEVYSLDGKLVHREVLNIASGTSRTRVDLGELSSANYMLNLLSGEASVSLGVRVE